MNDTGIGWGRHPRLPPARQVVLRDRNAALPQTSTTLLPHGLGRSYGDSCQNGDGTLLLTRGLDRFIHFDREAGVLACEAGVSLDEILRLVVPHGWFLPAVPGTRFVTVGGAIANDVHGKNHHRAGSFGRHVRRFELLRSDGRRLVCSPEENTGLFEATIGGLGLTGLMTWAEIRLAPIPGPWMQVEHVRFAGLDEFFALSEASANSHEHSVAWIDCLARGNKAGRGIFSRANFVADSRPARQLAPPRLAVPFTPPVPMIGGLGARFFNGAWYRRPLRRPRRQPYAPFLFPLDGIAEWNRLYGPRGFLQHQCVIPPESERDAVQELLHAVASAGSGSFLAVLKRFGDLPSPGLLSFARPGTTLALDFPNRGDATLSLLDRLDGVVAAAGGAVYPAKDARMSGRHFRQFFPRWPAFDQLRDPAFSSSFWRRVMTGSGRMQ
ncbi:FAD-binding oxidoreductase [Pseudofulvimonas gallinarii]|uniref:FAD/FMN-containing dehydrogenase n=1 Tax=Pseudofulvimonas gallinarii TaxID=634155 RepID=A0A4R3LFF0_9GAMM|nr:FAD-binding oxidoreductase [Pseudofulvimonas gallinarii]TCS98220.1 FAD/FMN-containing dehydrogenase [Pseudofulvimonas gallinarii]THD13804.1 FAD-binding oxidoreductase [Pseudofulvimonas gallinarii]